MNKGIQHINVSPLFYFPIIILLLLQVHGITAQAQSCVCDGTVPTYTVDLSNSPIDSASFTNIVRQGLCCGLTGSTKCIRFIVILHPNTSILEFDYLGAPASDYMINCTDPHPIRDPVCVEGLDTFCITYCKPGGNVGDYKIKGSYLVQASQDIAVASGCSAEISVGGLDEASIIWNTIFPGASGDYNHYLDCVSACDTVTISPQPGYPPYIDIEVTGTQESVCNTLNTRDTVRVHFVGSRNVLIDPPSPSICFGETDVTLTAQAIGGAPPYSYLWNTGETTPGITVSAAGTYSVEVSDSTACPPVRDTVTVIQHSSLIATDAGSDSILCSTSPSYLLQGSVTQATGAYWWGGSGSFAPDTTELNATYTPSLAEINNDSVILKLTTTGNGSCLAQTDSVTLYYVQPPTANITGAFEICETETLTVIPGSATATNYSTLQWTTEGTGSFTDENSLTPQYAPSANDIASGSVRLILHAYGLGNCTQATDTLTLTIRKITSVNAGNDISSCVSIPSVNLLGAISGGSNTGIWSSNGNGYFSPATDNLLASYIPGDMDTSTRIVSLKLTATNTGACPVNSDSLVLTLTNNPYAYAGSDSSYCTNSGASIQLNGVVNNSASFSWSTNGDGIFNNSSLLAPTYTPGSNDLTNGSVILRLSTQGNGSCQESQSTQLMLLQQPPVVTVPADRSLCANNATTALSGSVTGTSLYQWLSTGTGTYIPNAFDLNPVYYPSSTDTASGKVKLILSAQNNCATTNDTVEISFTPAPVVRAGTDINTCYDGTPLALDGYVSAVAGGGNWLSTGTGSFSPGATQLSTAYIPSAGDTSAGTVSLILQSTFNGSCLAVTDTLLVSFQQSASVNISGDTLVCFNNSIHTEASILGGSGAGLWTLVQGNGAFSPNNTTNPVAYIPHSNDELAGRIVLQYTSIETGNCAPASAMHEVILMENPVANAGEDQIRCANNANATLTGSIEHATVYQWSTAGTGNFLPDNTSLTTTYYPSASDTATGQVWLKLSALDGCETAHDSLLLTLSSAPWANAGTSIYICSGAAGTPVQGSVSSNVSGGTWTTSGDGTFTNPSQLSTQYNLGTADMLQDSLFLFLTTTGNGLCNAVRDSVLVVKTSTPTVSVDPVLAICGNDTAQLHVSISNGTPAGRWQSRGDGHFTPSDTSLQAGYIPGTNDELSGSVQLVFTTTESCVPVSDSALLTVLAAPTVTADSDQYICESIPSIALNSNATGWAQPVAWSSNGSGNFIPATNMLSPSYQLSAADRIRDSLWMQVQTTNNGSCPPASDTSWIFIEHPPLPVAGSDLTICLGDSALLTGSITGGNDTSQWITRGDGIFLESEYTLHNIYLPGTTDQISGSVWLILQANATYCNPESDSLRIDFSPAHVALAGNDTSMCETDTGIEIMGAYLYATGVEWSGAGSFSPSISAATVTYVPTQEEINTGLAQLVLQTTSVDGCTPDRDTMQISIEKLPTVYAGEDMYLCKGSEQASLNGQISGTVTSGFWATSGSGTFTPDSSQLQGVYNLSAADTAIGEIALMLHSAPPPTCNTTSDTVHLFLTDIPTVNAGVDDTLCANQAAWSIPGIVNPTNTRATWSVPNGDGTFSPSPDSLLTYYTPGPGDIASGDAHLVLTSTHTCLPIRDTVQLTITPAPVIQLADTLVFCENTPDIAIHASISGGASAGQWSSSGDGTFDNSALLSTLYHPGATDISIQQVWLYLITTDHGNCLPVQDSVLIRFSTKPTAAILAPDSVCSGAGTPISSLSTSPEDPLALEWLINAYTYSDSSILHEFSLPGWNDIRLIATNPLGCSDTSYHPIYVSTGPVSSFTLSNKCSGDTLSVLNLSTSDIYWQWFVDNSLVSTQENPDNILLDTAGVYPVVLVTYNPLGCTDTSRINHRVYSTPEAGFAYTSACQLTEMQFTDTSLIVNGTIQNWWWNFGDGSFSALSSPVHQYGMDDTATVSLLVSTLHCSNSLTKQIPLTRAIQITASATSGCTPFHVQLASNQDSASVFLWDFGNGEQANSATPQISFTNYSGTPSNYPVTVEINNTAGCTQHDTLVLTAFPIPEANFSLSDFNLCPGDSVKLTQLTATSTRSWKLNDSILARTDSTFYLLLNNPNIATSYHPIKMIAGNPWGCTDSTQRIIGVYGTPATAINASTDSVCNRESVRFTASEMGTAYTWAYGDGTSEAASQSVSHYYQLSALSDTTLQLQLSFTDVNGCTMDVYDSLVIVPAPTPGFTISTLEGCSPLTITLTDTSQNSSLVSWNLGDSSLPQTGSTVTHTYINSSTSIVSNLITQSIENSFGCTAQSQNTVYVYNQPVAEFTSDTAGCSPLNISFQNNSSGSVRQKWHFGDGIVSTQTNPTHSYLNFSDSTTQYSAFLIAESAYGCSDTSVATPIRIYPSPEAYFQVNHSGGCTPITIRANIQNQSAGDTWLWKPSLYSAQQTANTNAISYTYSNPTALTKTDELWLIVSNQYHCIDSTYEIIEVFPAIQSSFVVNDTTGCNPFTLIVTNTTTDSANYAWNFGDGNTSTQRAPSHTYYNPGAADITYSLRQIAYSANLCSDTTWQTIQVHPSPVAGFATDHSSGCSPVNFHLGDSSFRAVRYYLETGDGRSFDMPTLPQQVEYLNEGSSPINYDLRLTVYSQNNCIDTVSQNMVIYPGVSASFEHIPSGCSPLEVAFNNTSDQVLQYEWTFGDGAISGLRNPVHAYLNESASDQSLPVELIITSHFGCRDTSTSTITIFATPDPDFEVDPSYQVFPNATVSITNITPGIWDYQWDFGDNTGTQDIQPGTHTYADWGEYIILLTATSANCSDTVSHPIRIVLGAPTADYDSSFSGCAPLTVTFTNQSINAEYFQWYFGDGGSSDDENPTYTYQFPGTFTVELIARSIVGEDVASHHQVEVYPLPKSFFQYAPHEIAAGEEVSFFNYSDNAHTFQWDFGDASISDETEPVHVYNEPGNYDLSLISISEDGCLDTFRIEDALIVTPGCVMLFPNAFTPIHDPTADGYFPQDRIERDNNIFHPLFRNIHSYQLEIYNRWGERIFMSEDPEYGWTGYYQNEPAPEGVYVYKATATCKNGERISRNGTLTLIW